MLLLLPHTWSLGTVTWNLSRACSPLIQIASRSPKLFWASPCFRICPNAAGSWTSETWSFPRALITPCSCLIAILSLLLHPPPWLCCVNPCCASLLLVGRHRGTEAKPYGRGGCTGSFWGNQHCLCCCSLPPLLCLGWDLIFNYSVPSHFSVRLLPSITSSHPKDEGEGLKEAVAATGKFTGNKETAGRTFCKFSLSAALEN